MHLSPFFYFMASPAHELPGALNPSSEFAVDSSATTLPSSRMIMRGKISCTKCISWVETSMVSGSSCSRWISERRERGSNPPVGSSKTNTSGCMEKTVAMAMRFFSPILKWWRHRCLYFSIWTASRALIHACYAPRRVEDPGKVVQKPRRRIPLVRIADLQEIEIPALRTSVPCPGSLLLHQDRRPARALTAQDTI